MNFTIIESCLSTLGYAGGGIHKLHSWLLSLNQDELCKVIEKACALPLQETQWIVTRIPPTERTIEQLITSGRSNIKIVQWMLRNRVASARQLLKVISDPYIKKRVQNKSQIYHQEYDLPVLSIAFFSIRFRLVEPILPPHPDTLLSIVEKTLLRTHRKISTMLQECISYNNLDLYRLLLNRMDIEQYKLFLKALPTHLKLAILHGRHIYEYLLMQMEVGNLKNVCFSVRLPRRCQQEKDRLEKLGIEVL